MATSSCYGYAIVGGPCDQGLDGGVVESDGHLGLRTIVIDPGQQKLKKPGLLDSGQNFPVGQIAAQGLGLPNLFSGWLKVYC